METNRSRSKSRKRRIYRLRKPDQSTQTITVPKPPSETLDSSVQVWVMKEEPNEKMSENIELVNRSVQCIVPTLPGRLIILMLLLATLCGMASYLTRGDIYIPPSTAPGQIRNLRDTFVELTWAIVKPLIHVYESLSS